MDFEKLNEDDMFYIKIALNTLCIQYIDSGYKLLPKDVKKVYEKINQMMEAAQ